MGSDQSIMSMPRPPQGIRSPFQPSRTKAIENAVIGRSPTFLTLTWILALSGTIVRFSISAARTLEELAWPVATEHRLTTANSNSVNRTRVSAIQTSILLVDD